jgi:aminocarboxymuconate-semialdehyde decarboxylase
MDAYPNLKVVLSHLGGAIAYLAERIERGWAIYPESREHISRSPMEYFSQMWVDTVSFSTHALMCAYEFHGPERMMLGSDYPHQIGDLFRCAPAIEALSIPDAEKQLIYEINAREVFRI